MESRIEKKKGNQLGLLLGLFKRKRHTAKEKSLVEKKQITFWEQGARETEELRHANNNSDLKEYSGANIGNNEILGFIFFFHVVYFYEHE